jgi:SAM-dependent methyltransferase
VRIREPWPVARSRQRHREFGAMFDGVPAGALGLGLEIGGGDGYLASLVAAHCRRFITTDSYRPRLADGGQGLAPNVHRVVCDGTVLPFADASFDFIFSSSVLEHVRDRPKSYREMLRCLRPGGVMLHAMPSRAWKTLQMAFYYPHLVIGGLDLLFDWLGRPRLSPEEKAAKKKAVITDRWSDQRGFKLSWRTIVDNVFPPPHGEFPGHVAEWRGFGVDPWLRELRAAGLTVHRVLHLPLYSGYGFGLDRLRRLGERWGLSSHNAFIVGRADVPEATLGWFNRAPFSIPAVPDRPALSAPG